MSAEENIDIYRRFVEEVLNKGNVDAADQFFAPTLIDHSLPPDVPGTLDGFKEWSTMFYNAFPDGKWTIDFITGTGDVVAHHKSMVGAQASDKGHNAAQQAAGADCAKARQFKGSYPFVAFW